MVSTHGKSTETCQSRDVVLRLLSIQLPSFELTILSKARVDHLLGTKFGPTASCCTTCPRCSKLTSLFDKLSGVAES